MQTNKKNFDKNNIHLGLNKNKPNSQQTRSRKLRNHNKVYFY